MGYTIGIVDDHQLFLKSLVLMVESFADFKVSLEALNGEDLKNKMKNMAQVPDIILLDVVMPGMEGMEVAAWITEHYPLVKIAALSMHSDDSAILSMIDAGCCSYLLKNTHPDELEKALKEIGKSGHYQGESKYINFRNLMTTSNAQAQLSPREKLFLPYACSEMTYKEIASVMGVTEPTIENYRKSLFLKFNVQSRIGLVLEALRRKLIVLK